LIEIEAVVDESGLLRACTASGHAGAGAAGTDIVCAAVSVLMRTAIQTLSGREGVTVRSGAPEPGHLWMETGYTAEGKGFLFAAGEFLAGGLRSVAEEFPGHCKLTIRTERRT
jgi:uncharacterized protein YsxB (DUF464 family)